MPHMPTVRNIPKFKSAGSLEINEIVFQVNEDGSPIEIDGTEIYNNPRPNCAGTSACVLDRSLD